MINIAKVESIEKSGPDGFYEAQLSIGSHGGAIVILGSSLTKCVERTYTVLQAFNNPKSQVD